MNNEQLELFSDKLTMIERFVKDHIPNYQERIRSARVHGSFGEYPKGHLACLTDIEEILKKK